MRSTTAELLRPETICIWFHRFMSSSKSQILEKGCEGTWAWTLSVISRNFKVVCEGSAGSSGFSRNQVDLRHLDRLTKCFRFHFSILSYKPGDQQNCYFTSFQHGHCQPTSPSSQQQHTFTSLVTKGQTLKSAFSNGFQVLSLMTHWRDHQVSRPASII